MNNNQSQNTFLEFNELFEEEEIRTKTPIRKDGNMGKFKDIIPIYSDTFKLLKISDI